MSYFASSGCKFSDFSDGIRRKVVVKNKMLASVSVNIIVNLFVQRCSECSYCKRLCFASCKQCRAVRVGKYIDFAGYRPDFIAFSAVDAYSVIQNRFAQEFKLNIVKKRIEKTLLDFIFKLLSIFCNELFAHCIDCLASILLSVAECGFFYKRSRFRFNFFRIFKFYVKRT